MQATGVTTVWAQWVDQVLTIVSTVLYLTNIVLFLHISAKIFSVGIQLASLAWYFQQSVWLLFCIVSFVCIYALR